MRFRPQFIKGLSFALKVLIAASMLYLILGVRPLGYECMKWIIVVLYSLSIVLRKVDHSKITHLEQRLSDVCEDLDRSNMDVYTEKDKNELLRQNNKLLKKQLKEKDPAQSFLNVLEQIADNVKIKLHEKRS